MITCKELILKEEDGEIRTFYDLQTWRFFFLFFLILLLFHFCVSCHTGAIRAEGEGKGWSKGPST